jgi:hypothetical protein
MKMIAKKQKAINYFLKTYNTVPIPLVLLFGNVLVQNKYSKAQKKRKRVVSQKFHTTDLLTAGKHKQITRV